MDYGLRDEDSDDPRIDELDERIERLSDAGDLRGAALAAKDLGGVLVEVGDAEGAFDVLNDAMEVLFELGELDEGVDAAATAAWILDEVGEPRMALQALVDLLEIGRANARPDIQGSCLVDIGRLHLELGDPVNARAAFVDCRDAWQAAGRTDLAQGAEFNIGSIDMRLGALPQAESAMLRLREEYRAAGAELDAAECDLNLGNIFRESGRYPAAVASLEHALGVFVSHKASEREGQTLQSLGHAQWGQGRQDDALETLERGYLVLSLTEGMEGAAADALQDLAMLNGLLGRHDVAARLLESVGSDVGEGSTPERVFALEYNRALHLLNIGDLERSREALENGRERLIELGLTHRVADWCWNWGVLHFRQSQTVAPAEQRQLAETAAHFLVTAVLAMDLQRLQYQDSGRRLAWRELLGYRISVVFELLDGLGDQPKLAELIEVAINSGVVGGAAGGELEPSRPDLAGEGSGARDNAGPEDQGPPPMMLAAGGAGLVAGALLPMRPPPPLIMASGRTALAAEFEELERLSTKLAEQLRGIEPVQTW